MTFGVVWFGAASGPVVHSNSGAALMSRAPLRPLRFQAHAFRAEQRLPWLVPLWLAGVCALALRSLLGAAAARHLRKTGVSPAAEAWQRRLDELAGCLKISQPVALLESCVAQVPVVIGWLRPVILIPAGLLAGFPGEQIELILIHELAHIRRKDYLVNLLQSVVENLLFYHPAVWWVSNQMRRERENCCDDVVRECGSARVFAQALLALEQNRWSAWEAVLSAKGGHLMNRIGRLLEGRKRPRTGMAPLVWAGLLLAAVAGAMAAVQTPAQVPAPALQSEPRVVIPAAPAPAQGHPPVLLAQAPATPAATPAPAPLNPAFRSWLDRDAAYIITDDERSAFEGLQSDEEREKFIEQFWERRDPTPGTPENEYREEHYRRIAFANEQLGGWQTERAQIYIMFGPPDQIDDHSQGGQYQRPPAEGGGLVRTSPWMMWTYRYIEGLGSDIGFVFVDDGYGAGFRVTGVRGLPGSPVEVEPAIRQFQFLKKLRNQLDQGQRNQLEPPTRPGNANRVRDLAGGLGGPRPLSRRPHCAESPLRLPLPNC